MEGWIGSMWLTAEPVSCTWGSVTGEDQFNDGQQDNKECGPWSSLCLLVTYISRS